MHVRSCPPSHCPFCDAEADRRSLKTPEQQSSAMNYVIVPQQPLLPLACACCASPPAAPACTPLVLPHAACRRHRRLEGTAKHSRAHQHGIATAWHITSWQETFCLLELGLCCGVAVQDTCVEWSLTAYCMAPDSATDSLINTSATVRFTPLCSLAHTPKRCPC